MVIITKNIFLFLLFSALIVSNIYAQESNINYNWNIGSFGRGMNFNKNQNDEWTISLFNMFFNHKKKR
jgi:hypothetical protein